MTDPRHDPFATSVRRTTTFPSAAPETSMKYSFASFAIPSRGEALPLGSSLPMIVPAVCVPWNDALA